MKKNIIALFVIITCLTFPLFSNTIIIKNEAGKEGDTLSTKSKIDSIYLTQKQMRNIQQKLYKTLRNKPLQDKKYGIEINILRLLFFGTNNVFFNHTLSGGISFFNIDRHAEIAFPFYYSHPEFNWDDDWEVEEDKLQQFTLDCHYRRFLGNTQNGFYISGFIRYANLRGYEGYCYYWGDDNHKKSTENKLGVGIGVGYRKFSYKGFYWGTSLNLGRYIIGENDKFKGEFFEYDNDNEVVYSFELLKFGWAF